ncbi:MAG TPA: hypothetical protein VFM53_02705 [Anaeromyxobacteraceae bacterium]|nr:hypothetical protein [Anaeromyxobacteraceae bacterium]
MRRSASVRVGLLLAVSSLISCSADRPPERRCVDDEGRFVDEARCAEAAASAGADRGATASGATGEWESGPSGPSGPSTPRGGFHFIWIPYGAFGGVGAYAPGYAGRGTAGGDAAGHGSSSVTRGGFGATGAAHAAPATAGS